MHPFFAELVGTAILILVGNAVVANVVLAKTKGHQSGWIVISLGWGMAVFVAVLCVQGISGAHINPAVTIALVAAGKFGIGQAISYIIAQMIGATLGAALVYLLFLDHYRATDDPDSKLATFSTGPAIRNLPVNLASEIVGTFVLAFAVLMAVEPSLIPTEGTAATAKLGLGALGALPVALVVLAIGLSLGGTTGYAINPARDLGPRIAHTLLSIP